MVKKPKSKFVCNVCGNSQSAWSGKCPQCGEWNTFEEVLDASKSLGSKSGQGMPLKSISIDTKSYSNLQKRINTNDPQLDNVLGGGVVAGSIILLAGQPGIGKSTLLTQIANNVAKDKSVLYVSGEESEHQVLSRVKRLLKTPSKLQIASSTCTDDIASTILQGEFSLVIVDSIQTIACNDIASSPGSVSQITNSTNLLSQAAKKSNTAMIIVGHVTKEGSIAGPKLLEHSVDVVLQLEGDRYGGFKILRSVKNRYGSTNESAIYEMKDSGLVEVENPSAALLEQRMVTDGSIVLAKMEGTRPLLVEIQALVNTTSYGYPKRAASGFDLNRLNLLIAMLERRTKLKLADKDIYINVVGGIDANEPAADLAVCMSIASASKGMQLKKNAVVFGELGLSGEVRHVPFIEKRLAEARKLGFEIAIGPKTSIKGQQKDYFQASDIRNALNSFLEKD